MEYSGVELKNFRSYSEYSFELEPGVNIVVGPNASGKTNLLEALYVLSRGKSFRVRDRDLIKYGKNWLRIIGRHGTNTRTIKIKTGTQDKRPEKTIEINKTTKKRLLTDDILPVALFEPSHLRLLTGSPKRRREFLDQIIIQTQPDYSQTIRKYERSLKQRNALLKRGGFVGDELFVWNIKLAELGSQINRRRNQLIRALNRKASGIYSEIAKQKTAVRFIYHNSIEAKDYATTLIRRLNQPENDLRYGFTRVGPHREDFLVKINSKPSQQTASRGETRTLVLSAKIIEIKLLEKQTGKKPLLLFDDVFSELDGARRNALAKYLSDYQTIITTTDADAVVKHFLMQSINVMTTS